MPTLAFSVVRRGSWLAPLVLVLGCQPPTEITLEISTDIGCGALKGTAITVGNSGEIEDKDAVTVTDLCSPEGRIGSIVVVPSGGSGEHVALKIVAGSNYPVEDCRPSADPAQNYGPHGDPTQGCVVARRELSFIRHTPLTLDIDLRGSCVGEPCQPDQTCVSGTCVSSTIPDEDLCATDQGCTEGVLGGNTPPLDITAIWGRSDTVCASHATGETSCWGSGSAGLLGNGHAKTSSPVGPAMLGVDDVLQVQTGDTHSCLVERNGAVQCTGDNTSGQLGDGMQDSRAHLAPALLEQASKVAVGQHNTTSHSCAIGGDPQGVYCWGDDSFGKLGDGSLSGFQTSPLLVAGVSSPTDVAAGVDTTCAVTGAGTVKCWGSNSDGQFGLQPGNPSAVPVDVPLVTAADAVSISVYHGCALQAGQVWCWGEGPGNGHATGFSPPTAVAGIDDAQKVGTGLELSCVLRASHQVWCWGRNNDGQIGLGHVGDPVTQPTAVPGIDDASDLVVGGGYACALRAGNGVWCWGSNARGQVSGDGHSSGDGSSTPDVIPTPQPVPGL